MLRGSHVMATVNVQKRAEHCNFENFNLLRSFNREIIFDAITFPQKEETPAELTIQYPLALFSKFKDSIFLLN